MYSKTSVLAADKVNENTSRQLNYPNLATNSKIKSNLTPDIDCLKLRNLVAFPSQLTNTPRIQTFLMCLFMRKHLRLPNCKLILNKDRWVQKEPNKLILD